MPSYLVKIPTNTPGLTLKEGHNSMIVEAADGPDALAMAGGHYDGDGEGAWAVAVATEVDVAADMGPVTTLGKTTNFELTITITGATVNETFVHTLPAASTYAAAFTAMVVLLNAHASIAGAAFGSNLLTIADGGGGDDLGDHTVAAKFAYGGVDVPSFLSTVTHEGAASAVLSVATNASVVLPAVLSSAKS